MTITTDRVVECPIIGCDQVHEVNAPLLRKIFEVILEDPGSWNQEQWGQLREARQAPDITATLPEELRRKLCLGERNGAIREAVGVGNCQTAFCFAGHAAVATGHTPLFIRYSRTDYDYSAAEAVSTMTLDENGFPISVSDVAAHELGLTEDEARDLFSAENTLDEIRDIIDMILFDAGHDPLEVS